MESTVTKDNNLPEVLFDLDKDPKNYFDLWKYFSDKGDIYKDKLWGYSTWLFAIQIGLIAFWAKNYLNILENPTANNVFAQFLGLLIGIAGITFCFYIRYFINEYSDHIRRAWAISSKLKDRIVKLDLVLNLYSSAEEAKLKIKEEKKDLQPNWKKIPLPFVKRMLPMNYIILVLFIATMLVSLINIIGTRAGTGL